MPSGLPRVFQYSFTLKLAAQVCLRVVLSFRLPQSQVINPPLLTATLALSVFFKYHPVSLLWLLLFRLSPFKFFILVLWSSPTRAIMAKVNASIRPQLGQQVCFLALLQQFFFSGNCRNDYFNFVAFIAQEARWAAGTPRSYSNHCRTHLIGFGPIAFRITWIQAIGHPCSSHPTPKDHLLHPHFTTLLFTPRSTTPRVCRAPWLFKFRVTGTTCSVHFKSSWFWKPWTLTVLPPLMSFSRRSSQSYW